MRYAYADPARDPPRERDVAPPTAGQCAGGQPMSAERLSRRAVLAGAGALVVNFSLLPREVLIGAAASRWQLPPERLQAKDGAVVADDRRRTGYGELVSGELLHVRAKPDAKSLDPTQHRIVGRSLARVDIPAKVAGGEAYVQDLRFADMVHGRVVRPPSSGAKLHGIDLGAVRNVAGLLKVYWDGSYLAVIAESEYQAIAAARALSTVSQWEDGPPLPDPAELFDWLAAQPSQRVPVRDGLGEMPSDARLIEASYHREYQMHGSIGPSCAIGLFKDGALTVWTHSQGVYPLRGAIAQLTQLPPDKVRCIQVEGSGCYGHNGADDAGADAALLAMALPGRPVRVQWMREDEHAWEPYGSAMITKARAALGPDGRIQAWDYSVRSCVHATRPGPAGNLMPAWHRAQPIEQPAPKPLPLPEGGGHRNAAPLYTIPNARVVYEFVPVMPLRVSALRSLGAYMNIFSIESFNDELAQAAQADPVEFRLRHLDDPRAREVVSTAADRVGWAQYKRENGG